MLNLPSVSHGTGNTLSNQDAVTFGEVTSSTSVALLAVLATTTSLLVLHGINAAHATVSLDQLAFARNEGSTGRLGCTSQETTHHDAGSTEGKTLGNVANVLDTTIGNTRHAETSSKGADCVDSSGLGSANSHDLLGNAGGTTAHTNSETVNTGGNEAGSLLAGNDVAADDVQVGELSLAPLDHLHLVHAVTLGAVKNDNVKTSINKLLQTDLVLWASANGSSADELLAMGKLRSQGEVLVLGQIGAGDHGNQVEVLVHNGQFALLGLGQNLVGLGQGDTVGSSDELSDHDLGDRCVEVILELDVSVGNNTKELGADLSVLYVKLVRMLSITNLDNIENETGAGHSNGGPQDKGLLVERKL